MHFQKPDIGIGVMNNGNWIEIIPSVKGLANIYDKDILIYCISKIMHRIRKGEPINQTVKINSHDLLVFTNRGIGGKIINHSMMRLIVWREHGSNKYSNW